MSVSLTPDQRRLVQLNAALQLGGRARGVRTNRDHAVYIHGKDLYDCNDCEGQEYPTNYWPHPDAPQFAKYNRPLMQRQPPQQNVTGKGCCFALATATAHIHATEHFNDFKDIMLHATDVTICQMLPAWDKPRNSRYPKR